MGRLLVLLLAFPFLGCQTSPADLVGGTVVELVAGGPEAAKSQAVGYQGALGATETVVVTVTLKDCPPGSRCEFVRYWNNQFQDFQTVRVKKWGLSTEVVRWAPGGAGKGHRPGTYRVKVFLNGRFARQVDYTVG